jgi:adenylate cyclase
VFKSGLGTLSKDYDAAAGPIERALSLNPSCAAAHCIGAIVYAFAGHPAAAIANANRALRLSPFDLFAPFAHGALGAAAIQEARDDEAGRAHREHRATLTARGIDAVSSR